MLIFRWYLYFNILVNITFFINIYVYFLIFLIICIINYYALCFIQVLSIPMNYFYVCCWCFVCYVHEWNNASSQIDTLKHCRSGHYWEFVITDFLDREQEFESTARERVTAVAAMFQEMEESYRVVCSMHGENYKLIEPDEFFGHIEHFVSAFVVGLC